MRACSLKSCCHTEITRSLSERKRNVDIFPNSWGKAVQKVYSFFLWGVSRSCYLVDVVGVDAHVKAHVEVVEHLHHLQRSTGCRDRSEAHDVWEENGHLEQHWSLVRPKKTRKKHPVCFFFLRTPEQLTRTTIPTIVFFMLVFKFIVNHLMLRLTSSNVKVVYNFCVKFSF